MFQENPCVCTRQIVSMTSLLLWSGVQLVCCPWELESGAEQDNEVSIMPQIRLEYCYTELPATTNTLPPSCLRAHPPSPCPHATPPVS